MSFLTMKQPIQYEMEDIQLNGHNQQVYTLEVDMDDMRVSIENMLSFGSIYGFEETSAMIEKADAKIGVNGMFYTIYGHHIGLLVNETELITLARSETPSVAILEDNRVFIGDMSTAVTIQNQDITIPIQTVNDAAYEDTWVLYSKIYGQTTRISRKSINYIIKNNKITEMLITDGPVEIPEEGYVLCRVSSQPETNDVFIIGDNVSVVTTYNPAPGKIIEAFQSGGWLVKDGNNVAKNYEPYIGNTLIPNPRTLIGVTADNQVIVKVIDGRQKDSYGISGKEAAELMLSANCVQAVYLDGGASSTMVSDGKVVNQPSSNEERKVAHSIVFRIDEFTLDSVFGEEEKYFNLKNVLENVKDRLIQGND